MHVENIVQFSSMKLILRNDFRSLARRDSFRIPPTSLSSYRRDSRRGGGDKYTSFCRNECNVLYAHLYT